jgi:hypothetical protein
MFKLRNILLFSLIGALIVVEVFARGVFNLPSVNSQRQLTPTEQNAILSIMQNGLAKQSINSSTDSKLLFPNLDIPQNPAQVAGDTLKSYGLVLGQTAPVDYSQSYYLPSVSAGVLLDDIVPPAGSELSYAYQQGARFWYGKGENILVIYSDESIRSFNKRTGAPNTWLQDKLAVAPIADVEAYVNYQLNYRAQIVAETSSWVLMEFPSGGVLKVAKPVTSTIPSTSIPATTPTANPQTGSPSIYGLPEILPGYGN